MTIRKLTRAMLCILLFFGIGLPVFTQAEQGDTMGNRGQPKREAMISTQIMEEKPLVAMAPIDALQPDVVATASFGLG